jgi:DNA-binding NarL/FixJ family response regulator
MTSFPELTPNSEGNTHPVAAVDAASERKYRVLVVDDHPLLRGGLVYLLRSAPDLIVCGEASGAQDTILAVDEDPPPDIVILDLMLGNCDGLELIKQIKALRPGLPVLVISMHDELIYAERSLRAGASGFIMKRETSEEVLGATRAVLAGSIYLSGRMRVLLADRGFATEVSRYLVPQAEPPLSDRELHVFRLIGAGLTTKRIAIELNLSVKTIETYRENLKLKLGLANAAELLQEAKRWVDTTA